MARRQCAPRRGVPALGDRRRTGLNLTVLGSNGRLNFGALADRDLVPDVDLIVDALKDELTALSDAFGAR